MFSPCHTCHDTGKLYDLDRKEHDCPDCRQRRLYLRYQTYLFNWIKNNPFKTHPVGMALAAFGLVLGIFYHYPNDATFNTLVGFFGLLFVALKYKLDQAHYHQALFEKRYELYCGIQKALRYYASEHTLSPEVYPDEFIHAIKQKGCFLFSKATYAFLEQFLYHASVIVDSEKTETETQIETKSSEDALKKRQEAHRFFNHLIEQDNLAEHFPELKLTAY